MNPRGVLEKHLRCTFPLRYKWEDELVAKVVTHMCLITKLKLADFMSLLKPIFIWKAAIVWIRNIKK